MPRVLSIAIGLVMIATVTGVFIWVVVRAVKRSDDPPKLIFKWVLTVIFSGLLLGAALKIGFEDESAVIIPFLCVLFGIIMSVIWAPHLGSIIAKPLTSMFDGGDTELEPQPLYSMAVSRRKQGKYREAIAEIHKQLERFPDDFAGRLMLAQIQAENLDDLAGAELIIQRLCNEEGHPPGSVAGALAQLADWQLKYAQDPSSARESLEQIRTRFPESQFAHVASQRIAHLPTHESLMAARDRPPIHLPVSPPDQIFKSNGPVVSGTDEITALATEYINHLEQHPLDCEVREKLAMLYAQHYQRLDYAMSEIEQIIEQPGQASREVVRLLSVMANIQVKYGNDFDAARQALQRIVDQFPASGAAESAQRRIDQLKLEFRGKKENIQVQLGSYEQDIGLKKKKL